MKKPELHLTVGLPRSGKTTWALKAGHPIVNRDAIRLALHGEPYIQDAEDIVTALETYMVRALFKAGHKHVIVDACNLKKTYRDRWRSEDWDVQFITFPASKEICSDRALATGRTDLIPVIMRMALSAEWSPL